MSFSSSSTFPRAIRALLFGAAIVATRVSGDVLLPTITLDAQSPPLQLGYIGGHWAHVKLDAAHTVRDIRWYRNETTLVAEGSFMFIQSLTPFDAGLYHAKYFVGSEERRSQSFIVTVSPKARLVNVSSRCWVTPERPAIVGFVVESSGYRRRFLIRAVGPSLAEYDVPHPLTRPEMKLFRGQTEVTDFFAGRNGNDDAFLLEITATVGAFALKDGTQDLAGLAALSSGGMFTVVVTSGDGASGEVLIEVYDYD